MRNGSFRMLVIGDSVPWGQGLMEQDKYHTLVAQGLATRLGGPRIEKTVLAHSGATIGVGVTTNEGALDGEVPTAYPTILQQVDAFNDSPETVDLVLMNGGINDVDIRRILNPLTDTSHLQDWVEAHCHAHMKALLDEVTAKFSLPAARIIVTGYYEILSERSDPDFFEPFLKAIHGAWLNIVGDIFEDAIKAKIVKDCGIFSDQSATALQNAVDDANAAPTGAGRVKFVSSGFGPENAAFAPSHWLFGVERVDFSPEDEVIAARHASCDRCEPDPLQRWECYRASAGHPNPEGAKKYAAQILASL
jgi:lysophospholipase L1-like esterase